jgi:hypothetical protein
MAKQQKLTYSYYVGGVQVEKLTPEQTKKMAQRIGETLSLYYANHMDEYVKLPFSGGNEDVKST